MPKARLLESVCAAAAAAVLLGLSLHAQVPGTYTFTTIGSGTGGSTARFSSPQGIVVDSSGTLYIADRGTNVIRKITQAGVVTTLAGTAGPSGTADGTGADARFRSPSGVAVDSAGTLFVADTGNHSIRKITTAGVVTTYAGTPGTSGSAEGGVGVGQLDTPMALAVNASGVVFVANFGSHIISTVNTSGVITRLAGQAGSSGTADGTGASARFAEPTAVALDGNGDLLVTVNLSIRRVTPAGVVTTLPAAGLGGARGIAVRPDGTIVVADTPDSRIATVAADGTVVHLAGSLTDQQGSTDGQGSSARFSFAPTGVAVDGLGNAYVADTSHHAIRQITPTGWVTTLAGLPETSGSADGVTSVGVMSVAVDTSSVVYGADAGGHTIKKLLPSVLPAVMTTFAGVAGTPGNAGGTTAANSLALFDFPSGVVVDSAGAVFVADTFNNTIRKISSNRTVTTFAGATGPSGYLDGTGTNARFYQPKGLAIDAANNLYVTDRGNCAIRRITPAAVVSTIAGSSSACGFADGTGTAARFSSDIAGIAIGPGGTLYVADGSNFSIRAITSGGVVTTLAGLAGSQGDVDGTGAGARFTRPKGLTFAGGRLVMTDVGSHIIRTVTTGGEVTTIAGAAREAGSTNGTGSAARFFGPEDVAVDSAGTIYVADTTNARVRAISTGGVVTTFAGSGFGFGNGTGTSAQFFSPAGITVTNTGLLYVADTGNHAIRGITSAAEVTTYAGRPQVAGSQDGPGILGSFTQPTGAAVSGSVVYVADTGSHSIRRIAAGQISTLAGLPGTSGSANGTGAAARFNQPAAIAVGTAGIFVADSGNNVIRIVTTAGDVETFATGLSNPMGVAVHTDGSVYVADTGNHVIRRITSGGAMSTLAGSLGASGSANGTGTDARFNSPRGVAVASDGTVFVADAGNHTIRAITTGRVVTTIGGTAGSVGVADGAGAAARFFEPTGIAIDATGTLYIADSRNGLVRQGVIGTLVAPAITTQPTAQAAIAGQTAQFTVAATGHPNPIYRWKKGATAAAATYLADDATYNGVNSQVLSVVTAPGLASTPYWVDVTNSSGTVTSNSAALTVYALTTSPASLLFRGRYPGSGTVVTAVTPPQAVQVLYTGPGTQPVWTATASVPWLTITNGSGNGSGSFTVAIGDTTFVYGSRQGTVTISAPNLGTTTTMTVTFNADIYENRAPLGQVDTPVQNSAGVVGAIGVTGWALDDTAVAHVRVYRTCLEYDNPLSCQVLLGQNVVFIADAPFLAGARPDVEAAFAGYGQAHRAGWGMQVLTPMLPRTEGATALVGGQGAITLYVIATDIEGQSKLLGRSWVNDQTPTSITLANDSITKPFGTIDTPSHGGTASGLLMNYGWALTPDSNTTVDGTDIIIPTNGSTMRVFVDGVVTGNVTYDQCRGTVGNPVPAGVFCNDDIASIFGNTTPQAPLGTRTSNPTRYRNLDVARGAIGGFAIDTTTLTDGMHTVAWSVTDSANRVEGIGSRFFTAINGGARAASIADLQAAPGIVRARASTVRGLAPASSGVWGRSGFDLAMPFQEIAGDDAGVRAVRIPEMNRLELWLGPGGTTGHLEANDTLRDLPPGSKLDPETGLFTWAPGPGYVGRYRLVFVRTGAQGSESMTVDVTIWPTSAPAAGYSEIRMDLENIDGWARDPQAFTGHGIGAIHVWAQLKDAAPVFLGSLELRPDGGFVLPSTAGLPPGEYAITAYAWALRTGRWEDARAVTVVVR